MYKSNLYNILTTYYNHKSLYVDPFYVWIVLCVGFYVDNKKKNATSTLMLYRLFNDNEKKI